MAILLQEKYTKGFRWFNWKKGWFWSAGGWRLPRHNQTLQKNDRQCHVSSCHNHKKPYLPNCQSPCQSAEKRHCNRSWNYFSFFLYNIMIGRDNLGSLVSRVGVTLAFKVTHNLGRCLVEAFIGQNASLLFIITINYHNNIHGSDYQISRKNRSFQLLWW